MRVRDRFLMELYRRTDGRSDRTVYAHLHVAKPLHLSDMEARLSIAALLRDGVIEADAMYDRLIWLTPTGTDACERQQAADTLIYEEMATSDPYIPLMALRGVYADIDAAAMEQELITQ
jgi:hypothetical protein